MTRLLLTLLSFLTLVGSAQATQPQPYDPAVAVQRAEKHWHQLPACGVPQVEYASSFGEGAEWIVGLQSAPDCKIYIRDRATWKPGFVMFCAVVTHEYGHLLGLGHSQEPTDVMFPFMAYPELAVPECVSHRKALARERLRKVRDAHR